MDSSPISSPLTEDLRTESFTPESYSNASGRENRSPSVDISGLMAKSLSLSPKELQDIRTSIISTMHKEGHAVQL
ncbi:hypothetical protein HK405_008795, partial [Cladochytrium tenue]